MSDDTIKKNISKNIAKYREAANISQKELAKRLGVVPSRISNWETGANCPTIDILFEVCEILNVSINDIYGVYPDSKFVLKYGEQDLLKKYRALDEHGKEMVDFTLEKEYERSVAEKKKSDNIVPMAVRESSDYEVNAAHAIENAYDEDKAYDEDIMDDENF
jgi:transcriptional regulator with XRE-family HTH domain